MPPVLTNRWNLPDLGLGLGLRGKHIPTILKQLPKVGWFEVIADNALIHEGWLRHALDALADDYPLVLHGVTMNLGSTDPLDLNYLKGIKRLADRWKAPWVSDHLCWTGINGQQSHDLLPLPYSEEMLAWLTNRVRLVQDVLERPLLVENPSSYLQFHQTTMPEWTFLARLAADADCGLLLDVNNVYVASRNHDFAWQDYLAAMPWDRVCQMHVAGHTTLETHLFDSHIGPVDPPVWDVLRAAFAASGGRPLLLEWDFAIPTFAQTWSEAQNMWDRVADVYVAKTAAPKVRLKKLPIASAETPNDAAALMRWMQAEITGQPTDTTPETWIAAHGKLSPEARVDIHRNMYAARCDDALLEDYPLLRKQLGKRKFLALAAAYRREVPSTTWALEHFGRQFPDWLRAQPGPSPGSADLARLERAWTEAHLAPACPPFDPASLAALSDGDHERLVLRFAPATQVVALESGVLPVTQGPQTWLIARKGWDRHRQVLEPLEAQLLLQLRAGIPLGMAISAVVADDPEAEVQLAARIGAWLANWVTLGAVASVETA